MNRRKLQAHLGTITYSGVHPVRAWVKAGKLHFHRRHDRADDPEPICLKELYHKHTGTPWKTEIFETEEAR